MPDVPDWALVPFTMAAVMLAAVVVWIGWHVALALLVGVLAGVQAAVRAVADVVGPPFRRAGR